MTQLFLDLVEKIYTIFKFSKIIYVLQITWYLHVHTVWTVNDVKKTPR